MTLELVPYITIPLVSGIVGWGTNVLALQMTFYPLEYKGIRPFGWQGIIPSRVKKMAEKSVDLLTIKLIRLEEQFELVDPERVVEEMKPSLEEISRKVIDEVMMAQMPDLWKHTPQGVKQRVYHTAENELPEVVLEVMQDIKENINELIDLKKLSVAVLVKEKSLVNEIFLRCGKEEFIFIRRSGFYFGFLFGIIQAGVFWFYDPWWMLPLFGLIVGFATNWLAIKLIFEPVNPVKIGPWTLQGLFLKRQAEVADEYSHIISSKILTTEGMFNFMLRGPGAEKMGHIIKKHIDSVVDEATGSSRTLIEMVGGTGKIQVIKNIAFFRFKQELPVHIGQIFGYAEEALNIRNMLREKMTALAPEEFTSFLRPAFQEDEFTLILVGALLGGLAGIVQYLLFFADFV